MRDCLVKSPNVPIINSGYLTNWTKMDTNEVFLDCKFDLIRLFLGLQLRKEIKMAVVYVTSNSFKMIDRETLCI